MSLEILNQFIPDEMAVKKWQDQGVQFWLAHPDDELLVGWKVIQEFVSAGIPVTVVLMTLGEKGKYFGENKDPNGLKELRKSEFTNSLEALSSDEIKIGSKIFGFPDSELDDYESELKKEAVIFMRKTNPAAIFTFSEDDLKLWNHNDHKVTGRIVEKAAEKVNMLGIEKDTPFAKDLGRPSLFKFTQHTTEFNIFVPLTEEDQRERVSFAKSVYPSQFGHLDDGVLFDYFSQVSTNIDGSLPPGQRFRQIR